MSSWVVPGYTEVRQLGRGAAGQVVLAWHDTTGTPVAIRYLGDSLRADHDLLRRFRSDARLMSEVDSPNVTRLYEYVESSAGVAVVMELIDGVSLRALLREYGPTEPEAALAVLKGSLIGLAAAHARGVLHRDYRPENVLVDTEGRSRLTDFGLAVRSASAYLAPEQWTGASASVATDLYAATATFYECLVGTTPSLASDPVDRQLRLAQTSIRTDSTPEPVRPLLARGLATDPSGRPSDTTAFLVELAAAASAYGEGWEDRGRDELARRAARTTPAAPPVRAGESRPGVESRPADESSPAGRGGWRGARGSFAESSRWRSRLLVGVGASLAAAVVVASCLAQQPGTAPRSPVAAGSPAATGTAGGSPAPTATATATATQVTPLVTAVAEPAPSVPYRRPVPSGPTRPALRVTLLRIEALSIQPGRSPLLRVTVGVDTTTAAPVYLTLHQEGSDDRTVGGEDTENPTDSAFPLSGSMSYTGTFHLPITTVECARADYLLVVVVTQPAPDSGAATGVVEDPRC